MANTPYGYQMINGQSTYGPLQTQTSGSGAVPAAPKVQQLNAAPSSFTGAGGSGIQPGSIYYAPSGGDSSGIPSSWNYLGQTAGFHGTGGQNEYQVPLDWGQTPASGGTGTVGGGGTTLLGASGSPIMGGGMSTSPGGTSGGATALSGGYALPTGAGAAITANPWSLAANSAAVNAGNVAGGQATKNIGQGNNMNVGANSLQTGAGAVMNTAFDPQNALYNRTAQQLQDQVRVGEAARGITMSPYGAGVEDNAMSNFNIDWQNQQLDRQTKGLGAAGTATNSAGTANTTGANLGQMGVEQTQQVGQLPMQDYNTQQQQNIQNWIAYMNQANAATGLAQINYPLQLSQSSMQQSGGVPFIPQSSNTFSFGG